MEELSKKVVTLLALVTGHRMQTLSLIDRSNINEVEECIEIKIPDKIKTTAPNKKQPLLIIPKYTEDESICPFSALKSYIQRTKNINSKSSKLLISFKKPFNPVSAQTISRWIKDVLENSGVDTNIFAAYSTRHASTSAAKRKGISIDTIKSAAGWSKDSETFAKFYDKPLVKNQATEFGKAVLKNKT